MLYTCSESSGVPELALAGARGWRPRPGGDENSRASICVVVYYCRTYCNDVRPRPDAAHR